MCVTRTQSSGPGLEADPLQPRPQAGPQLLQSLLHPLGLPAPALQNALTHIKQRRGGGVLVRQPGTHTVVRPLAQDWEEDILDINGEF